jgi:hypothetical protein
MVSSKVRKDLEVAFEELASTSVDIHVYNGQLLDTAFDVFTANTFIAGVADKVLSGDAVDDSDRMILATPLILNQTFWVMNCGQAINIENDQPLFELAQKIEKVRELCLKITG